MSGVGESLSTWGIVLLKLLLATACGGIIGYQRERYDHPAGFRTHMLVCVGSAVFMLVSVAVAGTQFDPGRIAAQVASGIGFLGAGTIIKQGSIVRGLTTAASLWAVAGIGLAAGYNMSTLAIALLGTIVVWFTLGVLKRMEERIDRRRNCALTVTLTEPRKQIEWLRGLLSEHDMAVAGLSIQEDGSAGEVIVEGVAESREGLERAVNAIAGNAAVRNVRWEYR